MQYVEEKKNGEKKTETICVQKYKIKKQIKKGGNKVTLKFVH